MSTGRSLFRALYFSTNYTKFSCVTSFFYLEFPFLGVPFPNPFPCFYYCNYLFLLYIIYLKGKREKGKGRG